MWVGGWSIGGLGDTPLGRHGSTHRPRPSARQRDWIAGILERQIGMRRRSFGCARALALQELPSLPYTLHTHGSSPCGSPRSHSIVYVLVA